MKVRNALAPCATMDALSRVWKAQQGTIAILEPGQKAALVAMKDLYKRLIERGEIHGYL